MNIIDLINKNIDSKENYLLIPAFNLFKKFRFSRVTIKEICAEANLSKMTYYKHFHNKDELVVKLISIIFNYSRKNYILSWIQR